MDQMQLIQIGIIVIFVGFMIVLASFLLGPKEEGKVKFSFFGILGFIPFGISNDKKLFLFTIALTLVFLILFIVFFYRKVGF